MVDLSFQEGEDEIECPGCGTMLPPFLDGCPYCEDEPDDACEPCPECGAEIFDASEQCPACGAWIVFGAAKPGRGPRIATAVIVAIILALIVAYGMGRG